MESRPISNWIDSDSDDSFEYHSTTEQYNPTSQSQVQDRIIESLQERLSSHYPPYEFILENLPFSVRQAKEIYDFFCISEDEAEINIIMDGSKSLGRAFFSTKEFAVAYKALSSHGKTLRDRRLFMRFNYVKGINNRGRGRGNRGRGRGNRRRGPFRHGAFSSLHVNHSESQVSFKESLASRTPVTNGRTKTNPFGDAIPIDRKDKDIEFEMKASASETNTRPKKKKNTRKNKKQEN